MRLCFVDEKFCQKKGEEILHLLLNNGSLNYSESAFLLISTDPTTSPKTFRNVLK